MKRMLAYVHAYVGHGRNAGAESTLHDMLKALVRTGEWECEVLINRYDKSIPRIYTIDGVKVRPFRSTKDPNKLFPKYDVIITHLECSKRSSYLCRNLGMPLIQLIHNSLWQTEGYLNTGCDLAVFNTQWIRDHHLAALSNPLTRTVEGRTRITLGMRGMSQWDHCVLKPLVNPEDYATTPGDHITLVNFYENKGPHRFYELAERFPHLPFLGVLGGYGKQEVREGYDNVTMMPNTQDMREVYSKTKIILMPSDYETFGRIAVEAAASGIPSITTPTKGLVEALDFAGNFAELDDRYDWVKRLKELTENPNAYEDASYSAKRRSDILWDEAQYELATFIEKCDDLAKTRGRESRGG